MPSIAGTYSKYLVTNREVMRSSRMDISQAMHLWWVLPAAIAFSTIALSSGISGALFFSPFFLLVVGLPPASAIGAGLMTELFGTGFGSYNYIRQQVIDFQTASFLLMASIPAVIVGGFLSYRIEPGILKIFFGIVLLALAIIVLYHSTQKERPPATRILDQAARVTVIRARDGTVFMYRTCNHLIGMPLAGVGAFLTGLVSAGLPEITTTQLVIRCHIKPRIAVATSIFVLTVTAFFGAGIHAVAAQPAWHVVIWSIPGVIIGAQVGPRLSGKVSPNVAERTLGILFIFIGILVVLLQVTKYWPVKIF